MTGLAERDREKLLAAVSAAAGAAMTMVEAARFDSLCHHPEDTGLVDLVDATILLLEVENEEEHTQLLGALRKWREDQT